MTNEAKEGIQALVMHSVAQLGGQRATATKVGVSAATVSQIINNKWDLIADDMWRKIGAKLGYSESGWKIVPDLFNMRVLSATFNDAKNNSMMICVSHKAGSGKTAGSKAYSDYNRSKQVFYLQCREWTKKTFMLKLCMALGIDVPRGNLSTDALLELVEQFFIVRTAAKPLLIVDEADKLTKSALRSFIPLYNATEDKLGIVLLGTENLATEIKRGVRFAKKGYDEIDSRLGRKYVRLYGATQKDVMKVCAVNGITSKRKQQDIWKEMETKEIDINGQYVTMVTDLRRLKRIVQRELIEAQAQGSN